MSYSFITIPKNTTVIPVDSRSNNLKVVLLPTVSTNQGRVLLFKDYYGTASNSSFTISTTGTDLIDDYNCLYTLSNAFGAATFLSDGIRCWRTIGMYDGSSTPSAPTSFLPGLWAKFYSITGQPDSNGPAGNSAGTSGSGWGSLLQGTFTSGPSGTLGSNTPGPTNIIYYGDQDGYVPVSTTDYAAIYSGYMYSASGGTIQFQIQTDDGFRLDYNGANAILSWQGQGATNYYSAVLTMPAGYTRIIMRWFDTGGPGMSRMWYSINGGSYNPDGTGVYYYTLADKTQL